MAVGVILDVAAKTPINESVVAPHWIAIEERDLRTTAWPPGYLADVDHRPKHRVVTYRCDGCGLLESYAAPA